VSDSDIAFGVVALRKLNDLQSSSTCISTKITILNFETYGGNVTSAAGWQVTRCHSILHVNFP